MIFGVIEALTAVAGWFLGKAAAQYVSAWDHWIAFTADRPWRPHGLQLRDRQRSRREEARDPFVLVACT
jgi:Putative manganese efflux pump